MMSHKGSPAFQFYARDFVADLDVVAFSLEEVGAYTKLLCYSWLKDGLPDDHAQLAKALHVGPARFARIWNVISVKFPAHIDGRLRNGRQEEERIKQATWREKSAIGGRHSKANRKGAARVVEPPSPPLSNTSSASSTAVVLPPSEGESAGADRPYSAQGFVDDWNALLGQAVTLTAKRRVTILRRVSKQNDRPYWRTVFAKVATSPFCAGENDRGWRANIDWMLRPDTATKVLEGFYDANPAGGKASTHRDRPRVSGQTLSEVCTHEPRCETWVWHRTREAKERGEL